MKASILFILIALVIAVISFSVDTSGFTFQVVRIAYFTSLLLSIIFYIRSFLKPS